MNKNRTALFSVALSGKSLKKGVSWLKRAESVDKPEPDGAIFILAREEVRSGPDRSFTFSFRQTVDCGDFLRIGYFNPARSRVESDFPKDRPSDSGIL